MLHPKPLKEKLISMRLTRSEWEDAHNLSAAEGQSITGWFRAQLRAAKARQAKAAQP